MGFLDGIGGFFGSIGGGVSDITSQLFGSSQPAAPATNSGVFDPGGLSEFTAGTAPVYAPSVAPQFLNVADPSGGAGGGFADWLGRFASGAGQYLDPALKLGLTGLGLASGIQNMRTGAKQLDILKGEQRRLAGIAQPAAAAGGSLTAAGASGLTGGPLPAGLEAAVDKFKDDARMRLRQYLASTGQTDSSGALEMEAWIERESALYRQQLAEGLLRQGYGGISAALGPSQQVSQTAGSLVGASMGGAGTAQSDIWRILGQS